MSLPAKRQAPSRLGEIVKALRLERSLSLADLGVKSGITASTLSKVERGRLSLTYDRIMQLAAGLDVAVERLFGTHERPAEAVGIARRSVNRLDGRDTTEIVSSENYEYHFLNTDLIGKLQNPIVTRLLSRTLDEFGPRIAHKGEEFTYVLKGTVTFVCDYFAPVTMKTGESIYFDSSIPHAYLNASAGSGEAVVLTVCTQVLE